MAEEKKVVVTEQEDTSSAPAVEQKAEIVAPKTSDSEPKTDKPSELAKVETPAKKQKKASKTTKKDNKPAPVKDKSEKPAEEKPAESTDKTDGKKKTPLKVINGKQQKKDASFADEVKRLQALNLSEDGKPVESARDAMFPASFEVNGIKFSRFDIAEGTIRDEVSDKEFKTYVPGLIDAKNAEPEGCQLCLAFQWSEDMLAPKGAKGKGKSLYEQSTGIVPPRKFPHDLDILIVDAILNVQVEKVTGHSLYTEFPGTVEFSCFNKRTKDGWFDVFNAPVEVYLADFSKFNFSKNGMYVDLYTNKKDDNK